MMKHHWHLLYVKLFLIYQLLLDKLAKTMIVLACIDRFLVTSDRATFRAFSTPKRAKYLSLFCWCFLVSSVYSYSSNGNNCLVGNVVRLVFIQQFLTIYVILTVGLIPPVISGVFGYLTYRNMRQIHVRVQPVMQNTNDAESFHSATRPRVISSCYF